MGWGEGVYWDNEECMRCMRHPPPDPDLTITVDLEREEQERNGRREDSTNLHFSLLLFHCIFLRISVYFLARISLRRAAPCAQTCPHLLSFAGKTD